MNIITMSILINIFVCKVCDHQVKDESSGSLPKRGGGRSCMRSQQVQTDMEYRSTVRPGKTEF